ncbi:MAG TPA: BamA/TamA family outer membrane protein [Gemmatimonadales bacterium]|nr:BamA/TamA family outer membrane protein [Gemmatimonadales bacterium]
MLATLVAAVLAAQSPQTAVPPDSAAYLDPEARRLVAGARARRETIDRSITGYRATMRERIGVGIRALRRDRMLYRRELVLRIDWRRDSLGRIEVIGAREAVPAASPTPEVPDGLKGDMPDYAFDPADDRLTVGSGRREEVDSTAGGRRHRSVRLAHPLAPGSEASYRFATGDSSAVVFPDGRTIRLRELRVIPRRLDFRLMSGSLWIDEESHGVVRLLIRPARPFDFDQDLGDNDGDHIPGFVKPIRVEVRFITVDYGLWAGRWWLPRLIAMDAVATAGSFLQMPVRYERVYSDYEVSGDTAAGRAPRPPVPIAGADSVSRVQCHEKYGKEVACRCRGGTCRAFAIQIPTDTAALLAAAELPPAFDMGGGGGADSLISTGEMEELTRGLGKLPAAPWQFSARPPRWGLARYNRVEGLALGARGEIDFGRLRLDGSARVALADGEPDGEAGLTRETATTRFRLAGYRRVAAVDPTARSLGIGNSLSALLLGRDDGDYYRAAGAEVTVVPAVTAAQRFALRIYAERQRRAVKRTDFSLPHALHDDHVFRPNITADSADQLGAAVTLRAQRGIDPERARWGADVTLDGGAGTYGFSRASATLRYSTPFVRRLVGAVELGGGMSAGRVPVQSRWYLGGPATLRGYGGGATSGDAFWRARLEVANRLPAARLVLFADAARAGPRERLSLSRALIGVGVGASFVDGLFRIDLARALRSPTGWRLDIYTDAAL